MLIFPPLTCFTYVSFEAIGTCTQVDPDAIDTSSPVQAGAAHTVICA